MNEERKQQYFAELAPKYHIFTGNTTKDIFTEFLEENDLGIHDSSIIHDNGAGPGTATQALITYSAARDRSPTVFVTDYASGMIEALQSIKGNEVDKETRWEKVHAKVCNSADLSNFEDDYFTHSINNFSLFTMTSPVQCLRETYRTLKPNGTAAVLLWKRYAVQDLLAAAQDIVKGDGYAAANAVPVNGPQYYEEGVVEKQMVEAGFAKDKMNTVMRSLILKEGDNWDGLVQYLSSSSIADGSTRGWTEEEKGKWNAAILQAMQKEKAVNGGVKFFSWITVAKK